MKNIKKFGIIDPEVMQDPNLSLRAKGIYSLLCTFANKERKCFPKVLTIAEFSGMSRRSVERLLKELEQKGYVKREGRTFMVR